VWLSEKEIGLIKKRNAGVVHNPTSNMKLSVGGVFNYPAVSKAGIRISLGTDGCSSNNNLDMFEEMKIAGLLQKHHHVNPTIMPANEIFDMATIGGAEVFGLDMGLSEGKLADLILVDMRKHLLTPTHNLHSNLVYSATGNCVHTTICNGRILMHDRRVKNEEEIINEARDAAIALVNRES
jgi:5-methylthioadenosine/S-adenosylhomocysteine deaminase